MEKFSATINIYKNDNPSHFRIALESIIGQTMPADEIVILQDGPIPAELESVVCEYMARYEHIRLIALPENQGHGKARNIAIENCRYPYIAIMDADDIARSDRFQQQMTFLTSHPDVDIVGGQIAEFIDTPDQRVGIRRVPLTDADIRHYMKRRCPFNQMSVTMHRDAVLAAGNYKHWHYDEDYYLWLRMMLAGAKFANLPEILVDVRVGEEMYARRGGWKYFKSEARLMWWMFSHNINGFPLTLYNIAIRFVLQVCMPNGIRGYIFKKFARRDE